VLLSAVLLNQAFSQQTQPEKDRIPVEFYYNGKNKQVSEVVKKLAEGMRYKNKVEILYRDVASNPDHAIFVNSLAEKLPQKERTSIDIIAIVGGITPSEKAEDFLNNNIILFKSRHIAVYLNQAILFKLGMGVEKPPNYTETIIPPNPFDSINLKLNILLILVSLFCIRNIYLIVKSRRQNV
jgi:hypothetical protein